MKNGRLTISATFTAVVKAQLDDETRRKCKYYCLDKRKKDIPIDTAFQFKK